MPSSFSLFRSQGRCVGAQGPPKASVSSINTCIHHLSAYYVLPGSELETMSGSWLELEGGALRCMV